MQNGDISISMDQAMLHRNDYTDDYLHSRANAMQVTLIFPEKAQIQIVTRLCYNEHGYIALSFITNLKKPWFRYL